MTMHVRVCWLLLAFGTGLAPTAAEAGKFKLKGSSGSHAPTPGGHIGGNALGAAGNLAMHGGDDAARAGNAAGSAIEANASRQALGSVGDATAFQQGRFTPLLPEAARARMARPTGLVSGVNRQLDPGLSTRAQAAMPPGAPRKSNAAL